MIIYHFSESMGFYCGKEVERINEYDEEMSKKRARERRKRLRKKAKKETERGGCLIPLQQGESDEQHSGLSGLREVPSS